MRALSRPFVFATLLLAAACTSPEKPAAPAVQAIPVAVEPVLREPVALPVSASGVIRSSLEMRLGFKNGGRIARLYVEAGETVQKGQVLATLDITEVEAMAAQAAEAAQKARRDVERVENLYRDSTATLEQLQNARTGFEVARRQLEIAEYNKSQAVLTAGSDGIVLRRMANEGEWVAPGSHVLWMHASGAGGWSLKAGVADRDWARIRTGDAVSVTLDAFPGESFPARVTEVASMADPATGLFQIEAVVDPRGRPMASGLVARADITPGRALPQTLIPAAAVVEAEDGSVSFFVYDATAGLARRVKAPALRLLDNRIVLAGDPPAHPGVITTGAKYLRDGSPVMVLPDARLLASH